MPNPDDSPTLDVLVLMRLDAFKAAVAGVRAKCAALEQDDGLPADKFAAVRAVKVRVFALVNAAMADGVALRRLLLAERDRYVALGMPVNFGAVTAQAQPHLANIVMATGEVRALGTSLDNLDAHDSAQR